MKKLIINFLAITFIFTASIFSKEQDLRTLPSKHKKWLEEEVVYIITPKEKKIFLQLDTDKDRDLFIEAFWKQRDPNPITKINEFKEEYYKRLDYANRNFVRGTPLPGWKTDRGRIYIILGPPINSQTYEGSSSLYPTVVWFYQGMSKYGLPDTFYIMFFRNRGVGDYKLYSPTIDGPQSLLANVLMNQANYQSYYKELQSIDPNLARISLSLIPGEPEFGTNPSLTSDKLLFDINSAPQKKVKDEYAEKLLLYKDIIEVEYSSNYIPNDSLVTIIQDPSGIFFVNYLLEIDKFSMDSYEGKYFTKININGKISNPEGKTIFQYEKSVPFELSKEQFDNIKTKKYSFQDMFPLIQGKYKFNLLLKNESSKEFTSLEKDINIPESPSLQLSALIMAYRLEKNLPTDIKKAFKMMNIQLYPSPRNDFVSGDNLFLFFQIFGLNEDLKENGSIEVTFFKGEEKFQSQHKELKEYESLGFFLGEYPLTDFPPANYKIRVSILDKAKKEILFKEDFFYVSSVVSLPRSWINSAILPSSNDPLYLNILGEQFLNKNDFKKAKVLLEKAYHENPVSIQIALSYGNVLFILKEYKPIIDILTPFLTNKNYEFLDLLARSYHALGEADKAISLYKDYISHYGIDYPVLNSLGDCYYQVGNKEEALKAWEKSLEINPDQEKIKKLIDSIKKNKN